MLGTWLRGSLAKQQVVVKTHHLSNLELSTVACIDHEISTLITIDDAKQAAGSRVGDLAHVVDVHAVIVAGDKVYTVMEYCAGGGLLEHVTADSTWHEGSERVALRMFRQVVQGTQACHELRIAHRDIKPENVLLDATKRVCVADFGFAQLRGDECRFTQRCGTLCCAAPEVFEGDLDTPYCGTQADIWSLGVLLYATLCQEYPFADAETPWLAREPGMFDSFYSEPEHLTSETRQLLRGMLTIQPAERWTLAAILEHLDVALSERAAVV